MSDLEKLVIAVAAEEIATEKKAERPRCAVKCMPVRGGLCWHGIVGGEFCGFAGKCEHKITAEEPQQ